MQKLTISEMDENKFMVDTGYVAYHKVKRIFMLLTEIESENPEHIEVYEFKGQNFNLIE